MLGNLRPSVATEKLPPLRRAVADSGSELETSGPLATRGRAEDTQSLAGTRAITHEGPKIRSAILPIFPCGVALVPHIG